MIVEDRDMALGSWSARFRDDTPRSILTRIARFGIVYVLPGRGHDLAQQDSGFPSSQNPIYPGTGIARQATAARDIITEAGDNLIAEDGDQVITEGGGTASIPETPWPGADAVWAGVILHPPDTQDRTMTGHGMAWWLGTDQRGPIIDNAAFDEAALLESVKRWVPTSLRVGRTDDTLDRWSGRYRFTSARTVAEAMADALDVAWRVTPHGTVDAGKRGWLYAGDAALYPSITTPLNPLASQPSYPSGGGVVAIFDAETTTGGTGTVWGPQQMTADIDRDNETWATTVTVTVNVDGVPIRQATATVTPKFRGPSGTPVDIATVVNESPDDDGQAEAGVAERAADLLAAAQQERVTVKVAVDEFNPSRVQAGSPVGVHDPTVGLVDTRNPRPWAGRTIHPVNMRVASARWGVGDATILHRSSVDGTLIDLTDWLHVSPPSAVLELGDPARPLTGALA